MSIRDVAERVEQMARQRANESSIHREPTRYECQICRDEGISAVLGSGETVHVGHIRVITEPHKMVQCECVERKRIERLFKSSHITENFRNVGFKGFNVENRPSCVRHGRDTAVGYYNQFYEIRHTQHNSIILHGVPGSGKTHLLMAVANGLMRKGIAVQYFPWVEGFNDLRKNLDELEKLTGAMKTVEVLFLDDLYKGRQKPTDFMLEQLFGVVNYRYLNCLPMMVSSERTKEDMFAIDEGIARRIHERAEGHRVLMTLTDEERKAGMELNYSLAGEAK